jgi:PAS domain S-box-containing protein
MTERKKRERELRQFREAVEQTAHAVYITDTDGTIEYINQTFEELTGYSESEVLGQTPQVLSSGEHDDAFYEQFWETINAGQRWEDEMIDERADGEQIVIHQTVSPITDDDGEPKKFVAVARDITKRKEYQDAIERAREELRQIIDLVPDLIFVKNHDGEYLLANEATAEAYGSTPEKVEGKQESEVIPDVEDSEQFRQDDIRVIESGEPREIPEEKLTTAGGETRIFQTTKIPYEVSEADEPAVLGYSRDVTALKEYERQLEEQRDNLQVLNQVVRHDIRNDLQLVLAYGETLEAYVQEDGEEYVEQVIEAARDAVDITMTARDVTKVMLNSDVDQRPVPLRSTLENEIEDIQSSHENALVRLHGSIPSVDLHADDMLESVFRNLLNNAIQHNDKEVPEVTVSATYENETVRVQIADNGPEMGLSSEGTGLGLYLVDTLVNRYGGDVRVEDNDPSGSVFVVRFPLAKE